MVQYFQSNSGRRLMGLRWDIETLTLKNANELKAWNVHVVLKSNWGLATLDTFDYNKRMRTLFLISLSGTHSIVIILIMKTLYLTMNRLSITINWTIEAKRCLQLWLISALVIFQHSGGGKIKWWIAKGLFAQCFVRSLLPMLQFSHQQPVRLHRGGRSCHRWHPFQQPRRVQRKRHCLH